MPRATFSKNVEKVARGTINNSDVTLNSLSDLGCPNMCVQRHYPVHDDWHFLPARLPFK